MLHQESGLIVRVLVVIALIGAVEVAFIQTPDNPLKVEAGQNATLRWTYAPTKVLHYAKIYISHENNTPVDGRFFLQYLPTILNPLMVQESYRPRIAYPSNVTLVLKNVTTSDEGWYACSVDYTDGDTSFNKVFLSVIVPSYPPTTVSRFTVVTPLPRTSGHEDDYWVVIVSVLVPISIILLVFSIICMARSRRQKKREISSKDFDKSDLGRQTSIPTHRGIYLPAEAALGTVNSGYRPDGLRSVSPDTESLEAEMMFRGESPSSSSSSHADAREKRTANQFGNPDVFLEEMRNTSPQKTKELEEFSNFYEELGVHDARAQLSADAQATTVTEGSVPTAEHARDEYESNETSPQYGSIPKKHRSDVHSGFGLNSDQYHLDMAAEATY